MKLKTLYILVLGAAISMSLTKNQGKSLKKSYHWQYTLTENEALLLRPKANHTSGSSTVQFKSNFTFSDTRTARCGNDITYSKRGRYYLSDSKLILNYTGGKFEDNVGGTTRQEYVLGKVYYTITRRNADTFFLLKIKGDSERKVSKGM